MQELKKEKSILEDNLKRSNTNKISLENELNEMKKFSNDLSSKINRTMAEKADLEDQLHEVNAAQRNLEQDLKQKVAERNSLVSHYENIISSLRNELDEYKAYGDPRVNSAKLEDENRLLLSQITALRNVNTDLEIQLGRVKGQSNELDYDDKARLEELEAQNRSTMMLYEQEKITSNHLRELLKQKVDDLAGKDHGILIIME